MSEHGFYHPSIGYWQTNADVPDDIRAGYPEGTVEVPLPPSEHVEWNGTEWVAKPVTLDQAKTSKIAAIVSVADALLSAGAPVSGGLHVALNDGSRADLTAMSQVATNAIGGLLPWPESYSRGWISIENIRAVLPTPEAALTFAVGVGNYYSALVQHRRDLKDAALAAEDIATLDGIDITAGWPV